MSEKTLGKILDEAFAKDAGVDSKWHEMSFKIQQRCERAAQAVIEANEARKLQPMPALPKEI
jgi:hypothetical protein